MDIKRTRIVDLLKRTDYGQEVVVKGWVRTKRGSKTVSFIALNDGSTIKNVQIVADLEKFSEDLMKQITTGVLLLTNDGEMASRLTHPKFLKKKIYHARLDRAVSGEDLQKLLDGVNIGEEDGDIVRADEVSYVNDDKTQVGIEIHSGRNRVVRRMFDALGYRVTKLDRVQFAGLTKKRLRRGDWRFLTEKEVNMLRMGAYE